MSLAISPINAGLSTAVVAPASLNNIRSIAQAEQAAAPSQVANPDFLSDREVGLRNQIPNGTLNIERGDTFGNVVNAFSDSNPNTLRQSMITDLMEANPRLYSAFISQGIDFSNFSVDDLQAMDNTNLANFGINSLNTPSQANQTDSLQTGLTSEDANLAFQMNIANLATEMYVEALAGQLGANSIVAQQAVNNAQDILANAQNPAELQALMFNARVNAFQDITNGIEAQRAEESSEAQENNGPDFSTLSSQAENNLEYFVNYEGDALGADSDVISRALTTGMESLDANFVRGAEDLQYSYQTSLENAKYIAYSDLEDRYAQQVADERLERQVEINAERQAQQAEEANRPDFNNLSTQAENNLEYFVNDQGSEFGADADVLAMSLAAGMLELDDNFVRGANDLPYAYQTSLESAKYNAYSALEEGYAQQVQAEMLEKQTEMNAEQQANPTTLQSSPSALVEAANNRDPAAVRAVMNQIR